MQIKKRLENPSGKGKSTGVSDHDGIKEEVERCEKIVRDAQAATPPIVVVPNITLWEKPMGTEAVGTEATGTEAP